MKKLTAIGLIFVMLFSVFSLTSCGKVTAYSLITDAQEKMNALDSCEYDVEASITMDMGVMGGKIEVPVKANIKSAGLTGENPVSLMTIELGLLESIFGDNTLVVYTEGEWIYMVAGGEGRKGKIETDNTEEEQETLDVLEADVNDLIQKVYSEEAMKDLEVIKNEDGTRSFSMTVPDEVIEYFCNSILDLIAKTTAETEAESPIGEFSISNFVSDITVDKEGYLSEDDSSLDLTVKIAADEGISLSVTMNLEMSLAFKNPGTAVTVTPPEGYQDFPETDFGFNLDNETTI